MEGFWANEIVPQDLVELYSSPYVKAETEGEATYYGHGLWIDLQPDGQPEVYITGGDPVSFRSSGSETLVSRSPCFQTRRMVPGQYYGTSGTP